MSNLINKIESCDYQCEAGPLTNSRDWQELKSINAELLAALESALPYVAGNVQAGDKIRAAIEKAKQ